MTDRKKSAARSQAATLKTSSGETQKNVKAPAQEERGASAPVKSSKATTRNERKESTSVKSASATARQERREPRQEARTVVRKETKKSSGLVARVRNNRWGRFIFEAYYELRHKVTWPTPREARNMTIAVIALSAVIGGIIALADFGLHQLFLWIIGAR